MSDKPFVVCIPVFDEDEEMDGVVVGALSATVGLRIWRGMAEAVGVVAVRPDRGMGYSARDISDSVLVIGVGKGNV